MERCEQNTPVAPEDFFHTMSMAAPELSPSSICVLMAQSALETGRWKYIKNYNVGNIKAIDGVGDYVYFVTTERLSLISAHQMVTASVLARVIKVDGEWAVVQFHPPHPMTKFRAYPDLNSGVADYMHLLKRRYANAWGAVEKSEPATFAVVLHDMGYYTARVDEYEKALSSLYDEYMHAWYVTAAVKDANAPTEKAPS